MKPVYLLPLIVILIVIVLVVAKRRFVANEVAVRIDDIPNIFARLRETRKDGSFAAFVFVPPGGKTPEDAINLQFSIEDGKVGFDWVLLAPVNIRDRDRFVKFAMSSGYKVRDRTMNGVNYLRIDEGESLPRLCESVIRQLYLIPPDQAIDLIPEGFVWP